MNLTHRRKQNICSLIRVFYRLIVELSAKFYKHNVERPTDSYPLIIPSTPKASIFSSYKYTFSLIIVYVIFIRY